MSTSLLIKVSRRATVQIEKAAGWWQDNRPAAPGAVREDIARVLSLLSTQPGIGVPAARAKSEGNPSADAQSNHYYLYYRVSNGTLEVLAFWHTSREQQPRL